MWRHANETLGLSVGGRTLHIHRTSVVDSKATKKVITDGEASPFPSRQSYLLIFGTVVKDAVVRSFMRGVVVL